MQDKVIYEYAVIRLVPRVEREEFLNIGVILFSKRKKFLDMKYHVDKERLKVFAPELDIELINQYLAGWEAVCRGAPEGGSIGRQELPFRFRWLVAPRSTIIQSSATHPGRCTDPAQELEALFRRYVL